MTDPDGIAGTDGTSHPAVPPATRYAAIRKALSAARPMDNQTYLQAQIALILCDLLDEVAAMRSDMSELTDHLHEVIVSKPLGVGK